MLHAARLDAAGRIARPGTARCAARAAVPGATRLRRCCDGSPPAMPQEAPGAVGQVDDIGLGVDQHARRRVLLGQRAGAVRQRSAPAGPRGLGSRRRRHGAGAQAAAAAGRSQRARARPPRWRGRCGASCRPREQLRPAVSADSELPRNSRPPGPQREVEHLAAPGLHVAVEVDQQVAAGDQVELRERRIAQHVVRGEQHLLAQLLA